MGAGHDSKASTAVITAIVVTTVALEGQPVRLPVYGVRHTVDAVRVDGKLDEATWAMSPRAERGFHDPERFGYIQFMPPGNAAVPGGAKEP